MGIRVRVRLFTKYIFQFGSGYLQNIVLTASGINYSS